MNKKSSCQCPSSHENCPICLFNALPSYSFDGLSDLLSFNDSPPNVGSAISLRLSCIEASTTLPDLISVTRTMLKRMEEKQAVFDTAVRDISMILHPIRSLPDDILSTIFHWCTPYAHPPSLYIAADSLSPLLPPWTLSHVCRRWRALVLSSPTLWSTLSIPLDAYSYPPGHRPRAALRLELFLQRSRNVELDAVLLECGPPDESDEDEIDDGFTELPGLRRHRDFLQLLYPTIPRWRGLDVHIDAFNMLYLFRCSMAHLRRFS